PSTVNARVRWRPPRMTGRVAWLGGHRREQPFFEGFKFPRFVILDVIDVETGRSVDAAAHAVSEIISYVFYDGGIAEVFFEPRTIEMERFRVRQQIAIAQILLVLEEKIVHFPKAALLCRGFGGLRGRARMFVDLRQRKIPEDES